MKIECDCAELAIVNQHVKIIEIQLDCVFYVLKVSLGLITLVIPMN